MGSRGTYESPEWPPLRLQQLETLAEQGLSASQIARAFGGGCTRNAIIGKCLRMGIKLQGRMGGSTGASQTRLQRARSMPVALTRAPTPPRPPLHVVKAEPVLLPALNDRICRFPISSPPPGFAETTLFCGAAVRDVACIYCSDHALICFAPPKGAPNIHPNADRRRFNGRQQAAGMGRRAGFGE